MRKQQLPPHLRKYLATQSSSSYTARDHAVWRYVLKHLKNFHKTHAHPAYMKGLQSTGIELEKIPTIKNISRHLQKFGWTAMPVSGFIPPAAFMELQSLKILPIASDMRTLEHFMYTPAPDIVHEAAGHAPMLSYKPFRDYLTAYAQAAGKAILSHQDLALYEAIRYLSDLKENPRATKKQIQKATLNLQKVQKNMGTPSEGALLARMNWWTAEYGLIGSLKRPKIYGAGLLSSVEESKTALSSKTKKIPFSLNCLKYAYDITEPQPQLFVTPSFKKLEKVLQQFVQTMAVTRGGILGLKKIKEAQTINTVELDSGLQISGKLNDFLIKNKKPIYLQFTGPTQLCFENQQLKGHSKEYHAHGFGCPVGKFKKVIEKQGTIFLTFDNGIKLEGKLKKILRIKKQNLILTFQKCTVTYGGKILFDPSWGEYDMAIGSAIPTIFGGAADKVHYGEQTRPAFKVPAKKYSAAEKKLFSFYQKTRKIREKKSSKAAMKLLKEVQKKYPKEWLLQNELKECLTTKASVLV